MSITAGNIESIRVESDQIHINGQVTAEQSGEIRLHLYSFQPHEAAIEPGTQPADATTTVQDARFSFTLPRYQAGRDRLYAQFRVGVEAQAGFIAGPCYATELRDIAKYDVAYPLARTIKGLQVHDVADALTLGIGHSALNLNQPNIMRPRPDDTTITYEMDGREFYFDESYLRTFDAKVKELSDHNIIVNLILLNSRVWAGVTIDPAMEATLLHPDYDPEGRISAFNVVTADGLAHYRAFVEFVAERYSRPDARYGRVSGYIIGNEVDAQWIWCNAGEKTVEQYTREYALAVRTTFYAARKHSSQARVYLSLTHHWMLPHTTNPLRTYRGHDIIELFNRMSQADGDFDWSIAYHPYAEDLSDAEFWKDEKAWDALDSDLITFKNIQVLPRYLAQPHLLYDGRTRHIILSEQGLHSEENEASERIHAAAYALAYWKIAREPAIEAFIYHAHVDNRDEFDLNLGIRRRDKTSPLPNAPGTPKAAYYVFRDIDGPNQDDVLGEAQVVIDEEYWR